MTHGRQERRLGVCRGLGVCQRGIQLLIDGLQLLSVALQRPFCFFPARDISNKRAEDERALDGQRLHGDFNRKFPAITSKTDQFDQYVWNGRIAGIEKLPHILPVACPIGRRCACPQPAWDRPLDRHERCRAGRSTGSDRRHRQAALREDRRTRS